MRAAVGQLRDRKRTREGKRRCFLRPRSPSSKTALKNLRRRNQTTRRIELAGPTGESIGAHVQAGDLRIDVTNLSLGERCPEIVRFMAGTGDATSVWFARVLKWLHPRPFSFNKTMGCVGGQGVTR